jgi:hypothetical protein
MEGGEGKYKPGINEKYTYIFDYQLVYASRMFKVK